MFNLVLICSVIGGAPIWSYYQTHANFAVSTGRKTAKTPFFSILSWW